MRSRSLFHYVWAFPATALGLAIVALSLVRGGRAQIVDGVLEVHGGLVTWLLNRRVFGAGPFAAMTLGHVILGHDLACLDGSRDHEHVHVRQYERWGPLFIPAYFIAGAWQALHGRRAYRDNPFEREAYGDVV